MAALHAVLLRTVKNDELCTRFMGTPGAGPVTALAFKTIGAHLGLAPRQFPCHAVPEGTGMEARLFFIGHGLMENRSGLIVGTPLTRVSGHAERLAALDMLATHGARPRAVTLGADKGFVMELRELNVRPHVARTAAAGARRSTGAPPGIPTMLRASASASGSRRHSAGSRRWPA